MKHCSSCGDLVSLKVPTGDNIQRHVCDTCELVHYLNPRIIVCALPCYEDKVLLCKRAIEPQYGLWTVPGGFMENDESTQEGAIRETWEEAQARVELQDIYSLYNIPHINQVHIFFRANLINLDFAPGEESLEVELFTQNKVPWNSIAFPAVGDTLKNYFSDRPSKLYPMRCADIRIGKNNERIVQRLN